MNHSSGGNELNPVIGKVSSVLDRFPIETLVIEKETRNKRSLHNHQNHYQSRSKSKSRKGKGRRRRSFQRESLRDYSRYESREEAGWMEQVVGEELGRRIIAWGRSIEVNLRWLANHLRESSLIYESGSSSSWGNKPSKGYQGDWISLHKAITASR